MIRLCCICSSAWAHQPTTTRLTLKVRVNISRGTPDSSERGSAVRYTARPKPPDIDFPLAAPAVLGDLPMTHPPRLTAMDQEASTLLVEVASWNSLGRYEAGNW